MCLLLDICDSINKMYCNVKLIVNVHANSNISEKLILISPLINKQMKKLLALLFIVISIGLNGQTMMPYYNPMIEKINQNIELSESCTDYTSSYAGGAILLYTFYVLNTTGYSMSEQDRGRIALTGMLTATATYFIIERTKNKLNKNHK